MELGTYQSKLIEGIRAALGDCRATRIQAPTGAGKTVLFAAMLRRASGRGYRAYLCVHRQDLVAQTCRTLTEAGIRHGVVMAGATPGLDARVQVCAIDTLRNRLEAMPPPDLMGIDEAHHAAAATSLQAINHWRGAKIVGLTARPGAQ